MQNRSDAQTPARTRTRTGSKAPIKLSDVARLAGVSSGTVSRVLNQPGLVSAEATLAVRKAIDKLGWVPHGAARALASHKSSTVGAIIPNMANPIFAQMIYSIQHRLTQAGYILIIGCSEYDPEKGIVEARAMVERGIDGLILLGENFPNAMWTMLDVQQVPFLILYSYRVSADRTFIGFDNEQAARTAANHLLELGHRRIAILAQERLGNDRAEARLKGFLSALAEYGLHLTADQILERPWSIREGHAAFEQVLAHDPAPTAVICGNDYLAAGAIAACHERGLRVPQDISIIGFDDLEIAAYLHPPLTTVRVPSAVLGEQAAETLLARMADGTRLPSIKYETELVIRGSTAPPARI